MSCLSHRIIPALFAALTLLWAAPVWALPGIEVIPSGGIAPDELDELIAALSLRLARWEVYLVGEGTRAELPSYRVLLRQEPEKVLYVRLETIQPTQTLLEEHLDPNHNTEERARRLALLVSLALEATVRAPNQPESTPENPVAKTQPPADTAATPAQTPPPQTADTDPSDALPTFSIELALNLTLGTNQLRPNEGIFLSGAWNIHDNLHLIFGTRVNSPYNFGPQRDEIEFTDKGLWLGVGYREPWAWGLWSDVGVALQYTHPKVRRDGRGRGNNDDENNEEIPLDEKDIFARGSLRFHVGFLWPLTDWIALNFSQSVSANFGEREFIIDRTHLLGLGLVMLHTAAGITIFL